MEPKFKQLLIQLESRLLTEHRDLSALSAEEQFRIVADKVADHPEAITPCGDELLQKLKLAKEEGRTLRVKFGIDPTGPKMHLGHAVSLLMLRRFQQMGHEIQFVVGDFTARIGDPSDRQKERPPLANEQIQKNMRHYFEQAALILDLSKNARIETFCNSAWLSKMTMQDWLPLLHRISASQMFKREDFQKRLESSKSISMAELMYALFMAYDSVVLRPDIEIGGIDQFLNLYWCRELMRLKRMESELFIVTNLLAGTSGGLDSEGRLTKMSKSEKNYISIVEDPREMYGKTMSISDEVMWVWFRELTEISSEESRGLKSAVEKGEIHPMDAKRLLARVIVGTFNHYDRIIILEAERAFNQKFGKKKQLIPEDVEVVSVAKGSKLIDVLSQATGESKSNLRRMLISGSSGGIRILIKNNYAPLTTEELHKIVISENKPLVIKVGKRRYYKFNVKYNF